MTFVLFFECVIAPLLVAVVLFLTAALWRIVRRIGPQCRRFLDEWNGEPARSGFEARPGVMEQLAAVRDLPAAVAELREQVTAVAVQVAGIHYEVKPNGGESFADDVRRGLGIPLKKEATR